MTEIKHKRSENRGSFDMYYEGEKAGTLTYTWAGDDKFIIDHTEVDPKFEGKGLAKKLVFASAEFARKSGVKIIPLCPYAKSTMERTTELQDVLS